MYKCIKFSFAANAMPPDYFLGGGNPGVDHVFFPTEIFQETSPELVAVAISKAEANLPSDVTVFESQNALEQYLSTVWPVDIPEDAKETYTAKNKAAEIWAIMQGLNQTGEPFGQ